MDNKANSTSVLIVPSIAGYIAEQPVIDIANVCKEKGCMFVLDICGSIGMGGFEHDRADFLVCSFGKWKPVNLEYGGFVSTNKEELFDNDLIKEFKFDENYEQMLAEKLSQLNERIEFLLNTHQKIKRDLQGFEVIHKNKRGINVAVRYNDDTEKQRLINYCNEQGYEYTLCPRYIRVLDNAISIEVKRLG